MAIVPCVCVTFEKTHYAEAKDISSRTLILSETVVMIGYSAIEGENVTIRYSKGDPVRGDI